MCRSARGDVGGSARAVPAQVGGAPARRGAGAERGAGARSARVCALSPAATPLSVSGRGQEGTYII